MRDIMAVGRKLLHKIPDKNIKLHKRRKTQIQKRKKSEHKM